MNKKLLTAIWLFSAHAHGQHVSIFERGLNIFSTAGAFCAIMRAPLITNLTKLANSVGMNASKFRSCMDFWMPYQVTRTHTLADVIAMGVGIRNAIPLSAQSSKLEMAIQTAGLAAAAYSTYITIKNCKQKFNKHETWSVYGVYGGIRNHLGEMSLPSNDLTFDWLVRLWVDSARIVLSAAQLYRLAYCRS
jgi:hypothetical protein